MTLPASPSQVDTNTLEKCRQEIDRRFTEYLNKDAVLKRFLRHVQANNTNFTILELESLDAIDALCGLANIILEMYQAWIQFCGTDSLNPRILYPLLSTGGIPYRNMWGKLLIAANILMERQKQSGDYQSNIRRYFSQDSEDAISWISQGMELAQKISMSVVTSTVTSAIQLTTSTSTLR